MKYVKLVMEKIINLLMVIVIVAIFFCIYCIVNLKILDKDYINLFGYSFFQVVSGSMSGTIEIGDAVVVKIGSDFGIDDIVTYVSGSDFITHRVVEINGDNIILKGDANNSVDTTIQRYNVLGKVVMIIPNVATWKEVLLTPKVIILVFVTLFLFSLLFSYNGKTIKISMNDGKEEDNSLDPEELRRMKRRNYVKPKKSLESTQIIDTNKLKEYVDSKEKLKAKRRDAISEDNEEIKEEVKIKKKTLEATQIIDIEEIKKMQMDAYKKEQKKGKFKDKISNIFSKK